MFNSRTAECCSLNVLLINYSLLTANLSDLWNQENSYLTLLVYDIVYFIFSSYDYTPPKRRLIVGF